MRTKICSIMILLLVLSLLLHGCAAVTFHPPDTSPTDTQEPLITAEPIADVTMEPTAMTEPSQPPKRDFSVCTETYEWINGVNYVYYQIAGLDDADVESKINGELKAAAVDWFPDTQLMWNTVSEEPSWYHDDEEGVYQVGHYLWVSYWYYSPHTKRPEPFNIRATIDMETGQRVFLDDLIDINDDFLKRIRDDDIAINLYANVADQDEADADIRDWLKKMSYEELSSFLDSCQMDNAELKQCLENNRYFFNELGGYYLNKGELILFRSLLSHRLEIVFKLDDIEEFLKVPKW